MTLIGMSVWALDRATAFVQLQSVGVNTAARSPFSLLLLNSLVLEGEVNKV